VVLGLLSVIARTKTRSCFEYSGGGIIGGGLFGFGLVSTGFDHWRAMAKQSYRSVFEMAQLDRICGGQVVVEILRYGSRYVRGGWTALERCCLNCEVSWLQEERGLDQNHTKDLLQSCSHRACPEQEHGKKGCFTKKKKPFKHLLRFLHCHFDGNVVEPVTSE
jgi:hypothetical protein